MSNESLKTQDVMSVGSRVSLVALISGAIMTLTVYAGLGVFIVAIGLTTVDQLRHETLAAGAAVSSLVCLFVSLFVGGFVTSQMTAGENKGEAIIYGVLLWGLMFCLLVYTGLGASLGYGVMAQQSTVQPSTTLTVESLQQKYNLSKEQAEKIAAGENTVRDLASDLPPSGWAWMTFGGMVLSILASVFGAVVGAGPELVIKQLRDRRMVLRNEESPIIH